MSASLRDAGFEVFERMGASEKVAAMNELIALWREPGLVDVRPVRVIPDTTNRDNSTISASHMHYIAARMTDHGFEAHDLPVLVRENTATALGQESLGKWLKLVGKNSELPPVQGWMVRDKEQKSEGFFTSIGNTHFFQALNVIGAQHVRKFRGDPYLPTNYNLDSVDAPLRKALDLGVPSVVLRQETPKAHRKFISKMLNSTYELKWEVRADGTVLATQEEFREFGSFAGLAKHADAFELDEIVQARVKVEAKERRQQIERKKKLLEAKRKAKLQKKMSKI